ncbi:very short patch repair endonuclease [Micromonospora echinaurantiaca]|uniref:very short patch repair endonuclease n=1 Tax=Micromonospora echinaurantiaca TaxID=47857 RepID=UPI0037904D33
MTSRTGPEPISEAVRLRFRRQRTRDTAPEMALRRELHRRGLRYRVDFVLPGQRRRADVVFTRAKVAVFVDGCFWHRCPTHGIAPKHNGQWWQEKLDRNVARDREVDALLERQGWLVMRVWEHEQMQAAAERIGRAVSGRRQPTAPSSL